MGDYVGENLYEKIHRSKDALTNCASFDTSFVTGADGNNGFTRKPLKTYQLRGLKLRGPKQNQISVPQTSVYTVSVSSS